MISKSTLYEIISDQRNTFSGRKTIDRDAPVPVDPKRIFIISGIRRCGKSTLIRHKFLEDDHSLYLNFEDPRLVSFALEDFTRLEELAMEYGKTRLLLDEVQNVDRWELFARMANEKGFVIYITGSNASMLSRELGTRLTGRYSRLELFPFNFNEFLRFFRLERNSESFDKYFEWGGFPEYLEDKDDDYHRILLRDIVARDIAVRRNIANESQLLRLAVHLLSNTGKEFSYNKITKRLEFKSVRTVIDYCDYFRESYLMDFIPMYSASINKQLVNPKKIYCTDPAFAKSNSLSFSEDKGRRLENFVFIKLKQAYKEIFYFRDRFSECDFIAKQEEKAVVAVQSCIEINNDNIEREIIGIRSAMKATGIKKGFIVTYDQEDHIEGIDLIPAWKWL